MAGLTFIRAKIGSFMGLNPEAPIVIEFPPPKGKKRPIGKVTGDYRLGKSSFINFLLFSTGQTMGFKLDNLINDISGEREGEHEFQSDGETWKVTFSKNKFQLFKYFKASRTKAGWLPQSEAASMLKKLIGVVGISPMILKTDSGKDQVDWLFQLLNVPKAILDEVKKIREKLAIVGVTHANAKKEYNLLKAELSGNAMYLNYEATEKKYAEKKTIDSLREKMTRAAKMKGQLAEARERVAGHQRNITKKEEEIEEYRQKIIQAERELEDIKTLKALGDQYLIDNEAVDRNYEAVNEEFITLSTYLAEQKEWERVKSNKKEMDEFETVMQRSATHKDRLLGEKREALASVLPDIPELEVITEDELDGRKMGVYLGGRNPIQMSESELFDLYFKICRFLGVRMVVIENITSFGSNVIKTLNEMSSQGVYIWYTEMVRGQKEIRIEFIEEIE